MKIPFIRYKDPLFDHETRSAADCSPVNTNKRRYEDALFALARLLEMVREDYKAPATIPITPDQFFCLHTLLVNAGFQASEVDDNMTDSDRRRVCLTLIR